MAHNHLNSLTAPFTIAGNHCVVHKYHWPKPLRTVKHHIIPQEYGGKTEPGNLLLVCDVGHYNIHAVMDAILNAQTPPSSTRRELYFARLGATGVQLLRSQRNEDLADD